MSTCSICLDDNDNNSLTTSCNHRFHKICIEKWNKHRPTCPCCRTCILTGEAMIEYLLVRCRSLNVIERHMFLDGVLNRR